MVKIKICGITRSEDYQHLVSAGIDYIGFIFYEKSPRYISPEKAAEIISINKNKETKNVGVFVNMEQKEVRTIAELAHLDIAQLHGDETIDYCTTLGLDCWKVLRIGKNNNQQTEFDDYDFPLLLDTYTKDRRGGTGKIFDWSIARRKIEQGNRIILSGGISAENIKEAMELNPYTIDINSSVENSPGVKDIQKIDEILQIIKRKTNANR